jgi:ATP-binding protein involved in chromosome partitioning
MTTTLSDTLTAAVWDALGQVEDPELHQPITQLKMVKSVDIDSEFNVSVSVYLTIAACPLRERITTDVQRAASGIPGVRSVTVELDVMSDQQRQELKRMVRGGSGEPSIPFARPDSTTKVFCIASGKGGVGKSSVTVNLATTMARRGLRVGIIDADIHGHSIPDMLGCQASPTQIDGMIVPPSVDGIKLMSISMFVQNNEPVIWRGPMLHRALQQFFADVFWGDLDILLVDLPPGTGDIAISIAQLVPNAAMLVVTTPQEVASKIAERAGAVARQTKQTVAGVIENMSWYIAPDGSRHEMFGHGGGAKVADRLSQILGLQIDLLGQVPFDPRVSEGSDSGAPIVRTVPESAAARSLEAISRKLTSRGPSLVGMRLTVSPT